MLSGILSLDEELASEKLKEEESLFVVLKNKLTDTEVQNLKELNLPGVYLKNEQIRYYPLGSLASHLLGFVGGEASGPIRHRGFL